MEKVRKSKCKYMKVCYRHLTAAVRSNVHFSALTI